MTSLSRPVGTSSTPDTRKAYRTTKGPLNERAFCVLLIRLADPSSPEQGRIALASGFCGGMTPQALSLLAPGLLNQGSLSDGCDGTRTRDQPACNRLLYQLSYAPAQWGSTDSNRLTPLLLAPGSYPGIRTPICSRIVGAFCAY